MALHSIVKLANRLEGRKKFNAQDISIARRIASTAESLEDAFLVRYYNALGLLC